MTNSTTNQGPWDKLVELWTQSLSKVLEQITGKPFPLAPAEAAPEGSEPGDKDVYLTAMVVGAVRGEMSLRLPPAPAAALAKTFVGEQAGGAELTADHRSATEELLRQVAGHVATSAKATWRDFAINIALSEPPTWPPAASGWLRSGPEAPAQIAIEWQLSAALNASLAAFEQVSAKAPETAPVASDPERLEFFMGLELEVTLRFGGRDILLRDILQLGPGSVLELDREIQDPADLLLDGKLIARGEVVMVDGNYGLRVTEVLAGAQALVQ